MLHLVEFGREAAGRCVDDVPVLAQFDDGRPFVALCLFGGSPQVAEENGDAYAFAIADDRSFSRKRLPSLYECDATGMTAGRNSQGGLL
jgi:hypothetical protein